MAFSPMIDVFQLEISMIAANRDLLSFCPGLDYL